ncbi:MAG: ribosome-associated translation inhibitor RaiA [Nitratireductor sp.]
MSLRISGKHMNIGDVLTNRIQDRIEQTVTKYFSDGYSGQVTIEKSANQFECDCLLHLDSGAMLQAKATTGDATSSFEDAADKVEKRLRRYKRRLKDHHHGNTSHKTDPAFYSVVELPTQEEVPEDYNPVIIAESTTVMNTQSVAQAVVQLDLTDNPVVVFKNAASGETNVVYRRGDGNIGWIDPSRSK